MKTRPINFRCPIPVWNQLKKRKLENTEGLLRLLRQGLELEEIVRELGAELDQLSEIIGYDRTTVIRECVRGMMELVATPEGSPVTPLLMEEYAVGLKREAGHYRLELADAEPNPPFRNPAKVEKVKRDYRLAQEWVTKAEERAKQVKQPFVRATPEILALLEKKKQAATKAEKEKA